ncbi:MAG: hypothetical protein ACIAQZ_15675 [Sedimentisphaeraceae bacterium JB056]
MKTVKLLIVMVSVLVYSSAAMALHENATYSWNPSETEHDWVSVNRWAIFEGSWIYPFDSVPGATNTVDMGNSSPVNYAEIPVGATAQCLHLYVGSGSDDTLIVNGTLNVNGDFVFGSGAGDSGTAVVTVNSSADVNFLGKIVPYNSNAATICKLAVNGGTVDVSDIIGVQAPANYPSKVAVELKGGSFNPGYVAFYDAGDGSNFSIDIDGGDLVMNNYGHFTNDLVAKGCILASGNVVTVDNMAEMLEEDWSTYPGKVAFRSKVPVVYEADFDGNGKVDLADFSMFASEWLRVNAQ